MYSYTMDILNQGEYLQYETSSYSKKNKKCQHNLHYWRREPYLAFGPSGHGYNNEARYWNIKDAHGSIDIVEGEGVIGEQPTLRVNESYKYTSFCPLKIRYRFGRAFRFFRKRVGQRQCPSWQSYR